MKMKFGIYVRLLEGNDQFGTCRTQRILYYPLTVVAKNSLAVQFQMNRSYTTEYSGEHSNRFEKKKKEKLNRKFIIYEISFKPRVVLLAIQIRQEKNTKQKQVKRDYFCWVSHRHAVELHCDFDLFFFFRFQFL